jgi:hypothetical protein
MKILAPFLLSICICCTQDSRADENSLWFTAAVKSYHMDRAAHYNEKNYGIGLEYQFNKDIAAVAGEYKNSFYNKSAYYGVLYTPFSAGSFKAGILAGEINGYVMKEPRAYGPIVVPAIVWEGEHFGANMIFIPPVGNGTGVLGLQLKARF